MRVLILNYEFLPLGGGAGSATYYLSRELVRMGNDIVVLTSGFADAPAVQHSNGVEIHRVPSLRRGVHDSGIVGAASYLAFARRRMRRLLSERKFDLAHIYFALPTGLLAG
jgi:glycogen(starch) synthase